MADETTGEALTASAEKESDYGQGDRGTVSRWLAEIALYEGQYKDWQSRAGKIIKRYRDERAESDNSRKLNILWSNIQTLQPAIYARPPAPDVQRRYKDADPVGRVASTVLERALTYTVDTGNLDGVLKQCRDDYLLTARGQVWVRYEYEEGDLLPGTDLPAVEDERACVDYLYWKDFGHSVRRTWAEVRASGAVWRRSYLTRKQLVAKFPDIAEGETKPTGELVPLDTKPPSMDEQQAGKHNQAFKTACVYEIWDADGKQVLWIAKGYGQRPLKVSAPPIDFEGFFPCPEPFYGCLTTDSLIPLPDYAQYQDQAIELDILTERISLLVTTVRVAGLYNGAIKEKLGTALQINGMVSSQPENILIPVDDWAMYAEKGGMKGQIDWLPLEMIIVALEKLYQAREQVKQSLFEISGIGDIVRGQSTAGRDPTATEQRIKGRFASMRLDERQRAMARFARDTIKLLAEVIAEQFAPETLKAMTGVDIPDTRAEAQMKAMMGHNGGPPLDDGHGAMPPTPAGMPVQAPGMPPPPQGIPAQPMPAQGQQSAPAGSAGILGVTAPPTGAMPPIPPGPPAPPALAAPAAPNPLHEPPSWEAVIALLRDDLMRGFRIDIETDSTIALDEEADKKAGIELLQVSAPFFQQLAGAAATMPAMVPLMAETFNQVIRRFKLGRNIEQTFEETIGQLRQMARQPRPDPHAAEMKLEAAKAQQALQIKAADAQATQALEQKKAAAAAALAQQQSQADLAMKQAELAANQQREDAKAAAEQRRKEMELAHEFAMAQAQHGLARDQMQSDHNLKRAQMGHDHALKKDEAAANYDLKAQGQHADIGLKREKSQADTAIKSDAAAAKADQAGGKPAPKSQAGQSAATISSKLDNVGTALTQMAGAITALAQGQQAAAQQAAHPKQTSIELVRGKDGRAKGATVTTIGTA